MLKKLKRSKFSSGLHNQQPKCFNIFGGADERMGGNTYNICHAADIISFGVFSVNCLYEVLLKESRLCAKHILSSCITTQSIIKSDGSSGRTQENRALNAPPLLSQR